MNKLMEIIEFGRNLSNDHAQVVPISVFVAILCLCLIVGHLLEESRWVNESITAVLIGLISGIVILSLSKWKSSHILRFNEELFFIYLLPPIIFNAGFQVKKKQFFHNFLTIMMFGVIGVFISSSIITAGSWWLFPSLGFVGLTARDYLALGTIFSSTDTVCTLQVLHQDETPLLYSLVFGEGVVNDATSIVLFKAVQKIDIGNLHGKAVLRVIRDFFYLFTTSTTLGITVGLLTAVVLKYLYSTMHSSIREISLMVLMAYLSYILAELLELSGILTVFFCGIFMSHYAWHNVTDSSRITTRHIFAMMSFVAETFIFLYVGMDALDIEKWKMKKMGLETSLAIYGILILLILIGRAAFVFPLSALSNYMNRRRTHLITFKHQIVIWWAGLMRGAVSIALAFKQFTFSGFTSDPSSATMITSTTIVVLFTTLVFGFLTKPLIQCLLPHHETNNNNSRESKSREEDLTLPLLSLEESTTNNLLRAKDSLSMLLDSPVHTIHSYWRRFDDSYMRPIFGGPLRDSSEC
ncbi:sodium/hydrogen exchanger 4 [Mangifera indica]|uniref:sodium/hydrogen exchanger 4 n=1 Tax=Mangifera indica TaxID=29780 RepID=UPI001CFA1A5D|nr:sodium/hydrogen exchanger 4 [Mangifera indica]XP_044473807.1 sodium/hydrogen exchanger 4 [Mangifera indica]